MANRRSPPSTPPQRPALSPNELERAVTKIERRISELEAFDPSKVTKRFDIPEVSALEARIDEALSNAFGHNTVEYRRYERATRLDHGPLTMNANPFDHYDANNAQEGRQYLAEGKEEALVLLRSAVKSIQEELTDLHEANAPVAPARPLSAENKTDVFVVHGRTEGPKEAIARFLSKLGLNPIILHERPNKGRPLITKLTEEAADVGFAIVIMTPDDLGCLKDEAPGELQPRARQNVVFELGFFIGALGPDHVAAVLSDAEIEKPTDYDGVVFIPFDINAGWKLLIARELEAAGYPVDFNKVMRD